MVPAKKLLWYLGAFFLGSNVVTQMFFAYTSPRAPVPSTGHIYPLRVHMTVVYVTFAEHLVAGGWTFALAAACGLAWITVNIYAERSSKSP